MTSFQHIRYQGQLFEPLYPLKAVEARNHIFPLNTEADYEIQASLPPLPKNRSFLLPSVLYQFYQDLLVFLSKESLEFDQVFLRLGSPILENLPNTLLAPNVFISVDNDALIDLAFRQGIRRILSIEHNFLMHYFHDFGDNSLVMNFYSDQAIDQTLNRLNSFLADHNIQGEFTCL